MHAWRAQKGVTLGTTHTSTTTNRERNSKAAVSIWNDTCNGCRLETLNTRLKGADGSQTAMNTRAQNHPILLSICEAEQGNCSAWSLTKAKL